MQEQETGQEENLFPTATIVLYFVLFVLCEQKRPTPELTGRETSDQAFNLVDERQPISATVQ